VSNRLKAGLGKAFAPLITWARSKAPAKSGSVSQDSKQELDFDPASTSSESARVNERESMVMTQIASRGINNPDVLAVLKKLPRHEFVPQSIKDHAYEDGAMPIGNGQTISQPYIVALMTEALQLTKDCRVLEIGTGCGYQSAVLAALCRQVYSIEIVANLAEETRHRLARLGISNVEIRTGDGYRGWPEEAPFDRIIVTAAPAHIPEHLFDQLVEGGRMIIPVGEGTQDLMLFKLDDGKMEAHRLIPVRFVPMTGEAMKPSRDKWGT
jgi:protein-L-isoaspartate(D-aspartate) O-methyltransferase